MNFMEYTIKEESEKELQEMQIRIDCLVDKIAHCQEVIDTDGGG